MDTWLRMPLLVQTDTAQPTVRIRLHGHRTVLIADSTVLRFRDVTDSSTFVLPALGDSMPWLVPPGDLLRGLTTETEVRAGARGVTTRITRAPVIPPELPSLLRGVIGLATASARLTTFALPARAVRPGETWSDTLRYDLGPDPSLAASTVSGAGIGITEYRLERLELRDGRRVAIIRAWTRADASAQEPSTAATVRVSGTSRLELDLDLGTVVRTEVRADGTIVTRSGAIPVRLHLVQAAN